MTATAGNVALKRRQVARMRAAGLRVVEVAGWEDRGRPGTYAPVGVCEHHDASSTRSGNAGALPIIVAGRPGIAGPLSQWQVGRDGTWYLIAAGRSNHAGSGGPLLGIPKDSGNRYLEGVEVANNGIDEPYSPQLHASLDTGLACLLVEIRGGSLTATIVDWLVLHKTWGAGRKTDPRHSLIWRQRRVVAVLARWARPTPTVQEDSMNASRIKKANDPQQYIVSPETGAVPIPSATEANAWVRAGIVPGDIKVLPDAEVDALVAVAARR